MYGRKESQVGMNNCPDEDAVIDLRLVRSKIIDRCRADGTFCKLDAALVRAFDAPVQVIARNTRVRNAMQSLIRNGATRRTRAGARDAGIAIVTDADQHVTNVIPWPGTDANVAL